MNVSNSAKTTLALLAVAALAATRIGSASNVSKVLGGLVVARSS